MILVRVSAKLLRSLGTNYLKNHQRCKSYYLKVNLRAFSTAVDYNIDLKVNNVSLKEYIGKLQLEFEELTKDANPVSSRRCHELQPMINILAERDNVVSNISSLGELIDSDDRDVSQMAKDEKVGLESKLKELDNALLDTLLPTEEEDSFNSVVLEIQPGVGGQEAMLFAQEMFNMYCKFIANKGWTYEIADYLTTDLQGLKHGSILINGSQAYKYLKYEGGVHRVQRIPATEKGGRTHTSTVSVVALPQPSDIDIKIDQNDLKIETKRSTGAGGQHVNTTDSAVRIVHLPTNIAVECQVDRSQIKNRKLAMTRLRALLYQKELDSQRAHMDATRKSQVKSRNRNEKIRTYNYSQNRITDHRLQGVHYHNLKVFLETGEDLEDLIEQLDRQAKVDNLMEIVGKVCK